VGSAIAFVLPPGPQGTFRSCLRSIGRRNGDPAPAACLCQTAAAVTPPIELSGISVIAVGAFNPAIFQPLWFAEKKLMPPNAIDEAMEKDFMATREIAAFTADWLAVQVTLTQLSFSTVEEGREMDIRDLVKGVFELLPETPVDAVGVNADAHFRVGSEEEWHAIGDQFLPKDFWQPLFDDEQWKRRPGSDQTVGLRSMTVEATREDIPSYVRTELAPSVRVTPLGVYAGVNAHFQLTVGERQGKGVNVAEVISEHWDSTRAIEKELIERILEIA
jgi:hypothetical protein